jgi:hypothetical protein
MVTGGEELAVAVQALAGVRADRLTWIKFLDILEYITLTLIPLDGEAWSNRTILTIKPELFIFIWHHKTSLSKFIFPTVSKHG